MQEFYAKELTSVSCLKSHLSDGKAKGVLSIDIEGQEDGVHEIGLAFTPARILIEDRLISISIRDYVQQNSVSAYIVKVIGRKPRKWKRWALGELEGPILKFAEPDKLDSVVGEILKEITNTGELIMVAYDIRAEFRWISDHAQNILPFFSAWFDVQTHTKTLSTRMPSMQNVLKALNLQYAPLSWRGNSKHNAGNDAIHILQVLHTFLTSTPTLDLEVLGTRKGNKNKRNPFVFTAIITREEGRRLPRSIHYADAMMLYFAIFNPVNCYQGVKEKNVISTGYLSFNTVEELDIFVNKANGTEVDGMRIRVRRRVSGEEDLLLTPPLGITNDEYHKMMVTRKLETRKLKKDFASVIKNDETDLSNLFDEVVI